MKISPQWFSSYEANNYGDFFYSLIRVYRPLTVVELGTKAGYSAYHIAKGLKDNERSSSSTKNEQSSSKKKGHLYCFDLWEDYPFNSVAKKVAEKNLKEFRDLVDLRHQNAIGAEKDFKEVNILHVDLSNEGTILETIIPRWIDKVKDLIIIEGGSKKRDKVTWMKKYKKKPIVKWLQDFSQGRGDIEYLNIQPFPSVTIIKKII